MAVKGSLYPLFFLFTFKKEETSKFKREEKEKEGVMINKRFLRNQGGLARVQVIFVSPCKEPYQKRCSRSGVRGRMVRESALFHGSDEGLKYGHSSPVAEY